MAARGVQYAFNPAFPGSLKINARQVGENIEASRIASKTKEAAAVCKFLRTDAFKRGAELDKGRLGCLRVYQVCFYEKIDVLGKTRLRVKGDGVTANNQVSNAMGMEGGQKVFVVLVHRARSPSLSARMRLQSSPRPRPSAHAQAGSANSGTRPPSSRRSLYTCAASCP